MDELRAEWFRGAMRFVGCGLADRASIWCSWTAFCSSRGVDPGGKTTHWKWLIKIGARHHGRLFARIKML